MDHSRALGRIAGSTVHLKCENLQRAGSFKVRGAYVHMSSLTDEQKAKGVVAASAGNHAQGVALAASKLGIEARIYMPLGAALPKVQATRDHGATVVQIGRTSCRERVDGCACVTDIEPYEECETYIKNSMK